MLNSIALTCLLTLATPPEAGQTEVTIYNQGFALVKEVRKMDLKSGRQSVSVEDVAAMIEPTSVGIRSLDGDLFEVLEQNYKYDLISPVSILAKAVGTEVKFHRVLPNGQKETVKGILVSSPTAVINSGDGAQMTYNGMVIRTDDGRILLNPSGEVEVGSIPEGLISKPTLMWDVLAKSAGSTRVELSYLTQGVRWESDYVLTLDGPTTAGLRGWVTVNNNSGASWVDAKMKLLAGDVQRADRGIRPEMMTLGGAPRSAAKEADFKEESLFEYHLYTLQRPASIRNNEMKQISLLEADKVPYTKKLIVDAMMGYGRFIPSEGEVGTGNIKPLVKIEFKNNKESGLGMPLPKGKVKVYQRDASGSVQMLGEDSIEHTPKEEKLSLNVGRSFDVVAERKRVNFERVSQRVVRETIQVEVRNRKDTAETVHVYERFGGDWKLLAKTDEFVKLDAWTADFVLNLKAGEVRTLEYTVETRW